MLQTSIYVSMFLLRLPQTLVKLNTVNFPFLPWRPNLNSFFFLSCNILSSVLSFSTTFLPGRWTFDFTLLMEFLCLSTNKVEMCIRDRCDSLKNVTVWISHTNYGRVVSSCKSHWILSPAKCCFVSPKQLSIRSFLNISRSSWKYCLPRYSLGNIQSV